MTTLGMDEAGLMALTYLGTWTEVKNPVVTKVEEIRFWKRISDDDDSPDYSPVTAYQVSGRFDCAVLGEGEGYNRFMFIVERESRRVRGFVIAVKLSVLDG